MIKSSINRKPYQAKEIDPEGPRAPIVYPNRASLLVPRVFNSRLPLGANHLQLCSEWLWGPMVADIYIVKSQHLHPPALAQKTEMDGGQD